MDSMRELVPGTVIDNRYEIIEKLGVGGFAVVYKARHIKMERIAAIKIMSTQLLDEDETYAERFMREAQIGANLNHPNALTFYDFGVVEGTGQPYIAMEYLNGHDLHKELIQNGPMDKARVYKLFVPVLEALSCGHKKGIIHRDLKPENLFIVEPGTPNETMKVMDFGISKIQNDSRERLTAEGKILGTLSYFAPEYIQEQLIVPAGDVYQMALIISESLTGKPSNAYKSAAALYAHLNGDLNICDFLKEGRVGEVFQRAYCVDVKERYQDCGEFVEAFESVKDEFINSEIAENGNHEPVAHRGSDGNTEKMRKNVNHQPNVTRKTKNSTQRKVLIGTIIGLAICVVAGLAVSITAKIMKSNADKQNGALTEAVNEADGQVLDRKYDPNKPESLLTADELERLKVLNWLPVEEELEEIKELWKSAEGGSVEASEQLARHYLQLPPSREHYQLANKALGHSKTHSHPMAMADHARLGLQIMNSEHKAFLDPVQYDHYIEDILAAIDGSYKPVIFAVLALKQSDAAEALSRMHEVQKGDLNLYLQERSADWERVKYSLFFNSKHMARMIHAIHRNDQLVLRAEMDDDELFQWSLVLNRLKQLESVLMLAPSETKELREVMSWIETRIKEEAKTGSQLAQMLMAINAPDINANKILGLLTAAAEKGDTNALCIMTDLYMQIIQPDTISGELPSAVNAKVVAALRAKNSPSKDKLYNAIEDNLKRMTDGTCSVDIVKFYQNLPKTAKTIDAFGNIILDYLFVNAANSTAPRKSCDNIMADLKYDPKTGIPKDVFPTLHSKIYEEAGKCYMRALFYGFDYPQSEWNLEADSSGQILYQLNNAQNDENKKDFNLALTVYSAMYDDGILEGFLAKRYRDGDGVPKSEERMRFWATRAIASSQCKRCQSDLYRMNMCDVCVDADTMAK